MICFAGNSLAGRVAASDRPILEKAMPLAFCQKFLHVSSHTNCSSQGPSATSISRPERSQNTSIRCWAMHSLYAHITTLQLLVFSKVSRCVVFTRASTVLTTRTSEPHTMTRPLIVCHISFYYPTRQQTRDRSTPQPARVPYSYNF